MRKEMQLEMILRFETRFEIGDKVIQGNGPVGTIVDYKVRASEGIFALVEWDYGERHLVREAELEKVI